MPMAVSHAGAFSQDNLQVWSCGGLAEAFIPANEAYEKRTGIKVVYTGAFAAALGKSLLGSATTEVFGARVLDLAKKLRQSGKMLYFKPLCFTSYVMVTPKDNPAGIQELKDMARPGSSFPEECRHLVEALGKVYHFDDTCKEKKMSAGERLELHKSHSGPVMDELKIWAADQLSFLPH